MTHNLVHVSIDKTMHRHAKGKLILRVVSTNTFVCAQREGESGSAAKALTCTKFFTPCAFAALASIPATSTFTFCGGTGWNWTGWDGNGHDLSRRHRNLEVATIV